MTELARWWRKKDRGKKVSDSAVEVQPIPPSPTQKLESEMIEMDNFLQPPESAKSVNEDYFINGIISIVHSSVHIAVLLSVSPSPCSQSLTIPFQCPSSHTMSNKCIRKRSLRWSTWLVVYILCHRLYGCSNVTDTASDVK